jgi:hypothetical protein
MPACDKAVALAPENKKVSYQDSRGVARTLAGNYQGAIEDLDAYLKQNKTDLEEAKSQEDTVTLPQEYNAVLIEPLIEQAKSRVKRQIRSDSAGSMPCAMVRIHLRKRCSTIC